MSDTIDLDQALSRVRSEMGVDFPTPLAEALVSKVREYLRSNHSFRDARTFALNALRIWDKGSTPWRKAGIKIVAYFLGGHGSKVSAKKRKAGIPPKKKPGKNSRKASIPTEVTKGGQITWLF
jgi:hypothetical protein